MRYEDAVAALTTGLWRKSTFSQAANGCVEVGALSDVVGVRDSKLGPASPILAFGPDVWTTFTAGLKHR